MHLQTEILKRLLHVKAIGCDADLREEIRTIPKCELHVHLAGAVRRSTLVDLARKNNVSLPASSAQDFLQAPNLLMLSSGNEIWELFHRMYQWCWSCVRSCDDLERIVFEFLEDSYHQGVRHSEFTVSGSAVMHKFPFDEWTDAVALGIHRAQASYPIAAAAILDISRRSGPAQAHANVDKVIQGRPSALCGIGMGGDEVKYPDSLFTEAFQHARKNAIPSTVHVAEFAPGETTITTIEMLQPNRLGHALNTIKSTQAYAILKEKGIHVESCPLCNYLGLVGGLTCIEEHPISKYYMDGIPISINTDDPHIFGFDLLDNYVCLFKEAHFTIEDFRAINKRAATFGFIPSSEMARAGQPALSIGEANTRQT
ncbi:MAG: hypothetical protein HYV03_04020 [Deltaproteobacteria bacterium]|nr:hypothetical protein [Deltaproteobacteria bacterium]